MGKSIRGQVIRSSGSVFADMGLPDMAVLDAKARLLAALNNTVERQELSHAEVGAKLGINPPKVYALLSYKMESFPIERLMCFLVALGQDVDITLKTKPTCRSARIAVEFGLD